MRNVLAHVPPRAARRPVDAHPARCLPGPEPIPPTTPPTAARCSSCCRAGRTRVSFSGHMHLTEHHYLGADGGSAGPGRTTTRCWPRRPGAGGAARATGAASPRADCPDGTPNGYHVLSVDGARYTTRFVPAAGKAPAAVARAGGTAAAARSARSWPGRRIPHAVGGADPGRRGWSLRAGCQCVRRRPSDRDLRDGRPEGGCRCSVLRWPIHSWPGSLQAIRPPRSRGCGGALLPRVEGAVAWRPRPRSAPPHRARQGRVCAGSRGSRRARGGTKPKRCRWRNHPRLRGVAAADRGEPALGVRGSSPGLRNKPVDWGIATKRTSSPAMLLPKLACPLPIAGGTRTGSVPLRHHPPSTRRGRPHACHPLSRRRAGPGSMGRRRCRTRQGRPRHLVDRQDKGRVEIVRCAAPKQGLCGTIIWISEPKDAQGRPQTDSGNKNPALRNRPIIGLPIFEGWREAGAEQVDGIGLRSRAGYDLRRPRDHARRRQAHHQRLSHVPVQFGDVEPLSRRTLGRPTIADRSQPFICRAARSGPWPRPARAPCPRG